MPKYEVTRAWHGVKVGQVFEAERISPALAGHVRKVRAVDGHLTPSTLPTTSAAKDQIMERLTALAIKFDKRQSVDKLRELLPDGDPLKTTNPAA